jgi:hypothetical protein
LILADKALPAPPTAAAVRPSPDVHSDEHWQLFLQFEDDRAFGKNVTKPVDQDPLDLRLGFLAYVRRDRGSALVAAANVARERASAGASDRRPGDRFPACAIQCELARNAHPSRGVLLLRQCLLGAAPARRTQSERGWP